MDMGCRSIGLGMVLRGKPRNDFVLSTKVGRGSGRNGPNGSSVVRLPAG
jgi:aryl-alcohol dehydrogenase-like predicted oxidoreductase